MTPVRAEPSRPCGADPRFRALYHGHFGLVWSLTAHFGVPAAAREDVAQEVWLTVHRRIDALRPEASPRAWVASIARHVASRHHRSQTRHARKRAALSLHVEALATSTGEPDVFATVDAALARMDPGQREVFLLMQVEELSGPECSEILGLPLNTVYSRLRLARARLAEAMGERELDAASHALRSGPPPRAALQRVWVVLGLGSFERPITIGTIGGTSVGTIGGTGVGTIGGSGIGTIASTWAFKLAVAATAALATVVGTAALSGRGTAIANAQPIEHAVAQPTAQVRGAAVLGAAPSLLPAMTPTSALAAVAPARATAPTPTASRRASEHPARRAAPVRHVSAPPPATTAAPTATAATPVASDGLAAEAKLLRAASVALRGRDAAQARRWLERHAKEFPDGALAIDRRAAWARMLCVSGEAAAARALAEQLAAEHPESPTVAAVRDVCRATPSQR